MQIVTEAENEVIQLGGVNNSIKMKVAVNNHVLKLLRSDIYNNPIEAIIREICANARDANREAGRENIPIQIIITPNADHLTIKDNGIGISPDRMENVFAVYFESTKRSDNDEHGGFGLGCKTPLAYSDRFTVETIHDGVKYNYDIYIDDTNGVTIDEIFRKDTDEMSGTSIRVPIKSREDGINFCRAVHKYTRFWDVQPTFVKSSLLAYYHNEFQRDPILEDSDYMWFAEDLANKPYALIDGIPYPCNYNKDKLFEKYFPQTGRYYWSGPSYLMNRLVLKFNIGELDPTLNREDIQMTQRSLAAIEAKMQIVKGKFEKQLADELKNYKHIHEAYRLIHNQEFLVKPDPNLIKFDDDVVYSIFRNGEKARNLYSDNGVRRDTPHVIDSSWGDLDFENNENNRRRILKYMNNEKIQHVLVVDCSKTKLGTDDILVDLSKVYIRKTTARTIKKKGIKLRCYNTDRIRIVDIDNQKGYYIHYSQWNNIGWKPDLKQELYAMGDIYEAPSDTTDLEESDNWEDLYEILKNQYAALKDKDKVILFKQLDRHLSYDVIENCEFLKKYSDEQQQVWNNWTLSQRELFNCFYYDEPTHPECVKIMQKYPLLKHLNYSVTKEELDKYKEMCDEFENKSN